IPKPTKIIRFKSFLFSLYLISIVVIAFFLIKGASFYFSDYAGRPHIDGYRVLRPAGLLGHTFGVIGSAFMIFMLSYTFRKRLKLMRSWGSLNRWLDIHIYFGILGPLLVILHTSFKVQGLVAVSFWSMIAVAASGIFGRYLYLQIPRNIVGDEIDMKELEQTDKKYAMQLKQEFGLSDDMINRLAESDTIKIADGSGAFKVLYTVFKEDALRPFRTKRRHVEQVELKNIPAETRKKIVHIAHRKSLLTRRVLLLNQMQQMFHYWHVIHKPFAIIMYAIMVIHIGVAIWTGYKWIF
ncbi:MAG TPA: hypothetical protein DEO84_01355, partial [candidate division Zixibacteria bacterium]|nr:hypothetical protein [candidate division Zixibacteria bacterium]